MYNIDLKQEFIDWYGEEIYKNSEISRIFNAVAPLEEKLGLDICEFPLERLPEAVAYTGISKLGIYKGHIILKLYAEWCYNVKKYEGANLNLLKDFEIPAIRLQQNTVRSPIELRMFLEDLYGSSELHDVTITHKAFLWLAFSTVPPAFVEEVRAEHFDFVKMKLNVGGMVYPIYGESVEDFTLASELKSFRYYNEAYISAGYIERERTPGNSILRGIRGDGSFRSLGNTHARYNRTAKEDGRVDLSLSYKRVQYSGIYYRMYLDEKYGVKFDLFEYLEYELLEAGDKPLNATSSTDREIVIARHRKMRKEYERWKTTSGL